MNNREHEPEEKPESKSQSFSSDLVGSVIEQKIEVRKSIGEGGNGTVYEAFHCLMDKKVALKVLHKKPDNNPNSIQRFKNEAQVLSTFSHENIVRFLAFSTLPDGRNYMVLEFLEGITLAEKLKRDGPLTQEEALPIFIDVCKALEYAHGNHIIHRDIKPANIMLVKENEGQVAKLLDFGIFKAIQSNNQNLTQTGIMLGTVNYMSPEQCSEMELDQRSDIYALGCVMYEVLVGEPPMQDTNELLTMHNHVNKQLSAVPAKHGISKRLNACILSCCEKDLNKRVQSATLLLRELQECTNSTDKVGSEKKTQYIPMILFILLGVLTLTCWSILKKNTTEGIVIGNPATRSLNFDSDVTDEVSFSKADNFLTANMESPKFPVLKLAQYSQKCLQYKFDDIGYARNKKFKLLQKRLKLTEFKDRKDEILRLSYIASLEAWFGNLDKCIDALKALAKFDSNSYETKSAFRNTILACEDSLSEIKEVPKAERLNQYMIETSDKDTVNLALALERKLVFRGDMPVEEKISIATKAANSLLKALESDDNIDESRFAEFCNTTQPLVPPKLMIDITNFGFRDPPSLDARISNGTIGVMLARIKALAANNQKSKALEYATALIRAVKQNIVQSDVSDIVEQTYLLQLKDGAANPKSTVMNEGLSYLSHVTDPKAYIASTKILFPILYPLEGTHTKLWTALGPRLFKSIDSDREQVGIWLLKLTRDLHGNREEAAQNVVLSALRTLNDNIESFGFSKEDICEVYARLCVRDSDRAQGYVEKACKMTSPEDFLNRLFQMSET